MDKQKGTLTSHGNMMPNLHARYRRRICFRQWYIRCWQQDVLNQRIARLHTSKNKDRRRTMDLPVY